MNKEYLYINGKCVIYDENGTIKDNDGKILTKEYTDKLDEILIQENIIEALEDELDETNKLINKNKKSIKGDKSSMWICTGMLCSFPFLFQKLLPYMLTEESLLQLMSDSFARTLIQGLMLSLTTIFGGGFVLGINNSYKEKKRKLKGNETKKDAIEKSLEKEKEKLNELERTKQKTTIDKKELENDMCSKRINYLHELRKLRDNLRVYYACGYNEKKYRKYLEQGRINKKLKKYYTEEEIQMIKDHLEFKKAEEEYIRKLK